MEIPMRVGHAETTPSNPTRGVRGAGLKFKILLSGRDGSVDNYRLLLADTDIGFKSPRHRHNFDQVRATLSASTNVGPKRNIAVGDVAYFPEGTYYGPQNQEETGAGCLCMVIQFGGPSGEGFMSQGQFDAGFDEMQAFGRFEGGVFRRTEPAADGRVNQDAYEAIWEFKNGRKLRYAKPRYTDPIHMHEDHFDWVLLPDQRGVARKQLGRFTEKDVTLFGLRLDAGARYALPAAPEQTQIIFIRDGSGRLDGDGNETSTWSQWTGIHLDPGESPTLTATTTTVALVLMMSKHPRKGQA